MTDKDGNEKTVWTAEIVADRDIVTIDAEGRPNVIAAAGEKGGRVEVEVEIGEDGQPRIVNNPPVAPGAEGAERGDGSGLKGLSQLEDSWVMPGATLVGDASVRDNAVIDGPDNAP